MGIAAFAIALVAAPIELAAIFVAVQDMVETSSLRNGLSDSTAIVVFFDSYGGLFAELVAVGLGGASLFARGRKKLLGMLAIIIGLSILVAVLTGFLGEVAWNSLLAFAQSPRTALGSALPVFA